MDTVILGASGLVGSALVRRFGEEGLDVLGTYYTTPTDETNTQIDVTNEQAVSKLIADCDPDIVINAAAFVDVDACELERNRAWAVNVTGTRNAAAAAAKADAHFIYISTDYVFGGGSNEAPYVETDPPCPINYYGATKRAGEQAARIHPKSMILRSSVIYGTSSNNFLTWALAKLRDEKCLDIVDDQISSPTYAPDIAEACLRVWRQGITGLFHAAGPESLSRYEFTKRLAEAHGYDSRVVNPISTAEAGQQAARPYNSTLDSTNLYDRINYEFQDCKSGIEACGL